MQIGHELSTSYTLINESDSEKIALDKTTDENNLGIWCTNTLSLSLQYHKANSKAMRSLGLIKRTFKYINQQSLPFLYKIYVCPHLEFILHSSLVTLLDGGHGWVGESTTQSN